MHKSNVEQGNLKDNINSKMNKAVLFVTTAI